MKKIKLTKKLLIKQYIKNKKSPYKIAEEFNYCPNTIRYYLKKFNIKIRNKSEAQKEELNHKYIDGRTNKIHYCKEPGCNNIIDISTAFYAGGRCPDCGFKIISEKAKGRKRPDLSEINSKRLGNKHPNYIDGRSYEDYPQEFTPKLKLKIRKRDDFTCQECGMIEEEHIIVYGQVLEVHHIDYDKENCKENNLITTCKQCNTRANYNRKYWKEYFSAKVKEKIK